MSQEDQAVTAANPLAHAIASARAMLGYSVEGAAERLGIPTAIVTDAESGNLEINDELKAVFEKFYGIELDQLTRDRSEYAPRTPLAYDARQGILRVGTLGVRFRLGLDDNDVLLRGFSAAVRRQRQLPPSVPLTLRKADMPILASLLDLEDDELDEKAQFWFGQTDQTAQSFQRMLKLSKAPEQATQMNAFSTTIEKPEAA